MSSARIRSLSPFALSRALPVALGGATLAAAILAPVPWASLGTGLTLAAIIAHYRNEGRRRRDWEVGERRLKESLSIADDIIAAIPSGLIGLDEAGVVRRWNESATGILGIGRGGTLGRHVDDWPVSGQQPLTSLLKDALAGRSVRRGSLEVARSDGKVIPLGISTSRLGEGSGVGAVAIFSDLTEVHKIRAQMKQQERLAAVGTLAASIAHEIRNPLASIAGSVELLSQELVLAGENAELMDLILRESDRLNTLIGNFLEFTREPRLKLAPVVPQELVRDVFRSIRLRPESGEALKLRLATDDAPGEISADSDLLRQVFLNLILNACQAMNWRGEARVLIQGQAKGQPGWVQFQVKDSGPGIAAADRSRIFDPFFTTKAKGTGLGLAIAHRFAELHGGRLELAQAEGGAEFRLSLPLAPPALQSAPALSAATIEWDEIVVR